MQKNIISEYFRFVRQNCDSLNIFILKSTKKYLIVANEIIMLLKQTLLKPTIFFISDAGGLTDWRATLWRFKMLSLSAAVNVLSVDLLCRSMERVACTDWPFRLMCLESSFDFLSLFGSWFLVAYLCLILVISDSNSSSILLAGEHNTFTTKTEISKTANWYFILSV